jgi:hypothetical protein
MPSTYATSSATRRRAGARLRGSDKRTGLAPNFRASRSSTAKYSEWPGRDPTTTSTSTSRTTCGEKDDCGVPVAPRAREVRAASRSTTSASRESVQLKHHGCPWMGTTTSSWSRPQRTQRFGSAAEFMLTTRGRALRRGYASVLVLVGVRRRQGHASADSGDSPAASCHHGERGDGQRKPGCAAWCASRLALGRFRDARIA